MKTKPHIQTDAERIRHIEHRIENARTNIQIEQLIIDSGTELLAKIRANATK